jgi:hypothetical protein
VGRRRPPIQLGLALAPALTRCLSQTPALRPHDSRPSTGTSGALPRQCEGFSFQEQRRSSANDNDKHSISRRDGAGRGRRTGLPYLNPPSKPQTTTLLPKTSPQPARSSNQAGIACDRCYFLRWDIRQRIAIAGRPVDSPGARGHNALAPGDTIRCSSITGSQYAIPLSHRILHLQLPSATHVIGSLMMRVCTSSVHPLCSAAQPEMKTPIISN